MSQERGKAPKCRFSSCQRPTWDKSGYCPDHMQQVRNSFAERERFQRSQGVPGIPREFPGFRENEQKAYEIFNSAKQVFPDIDYSLHPNSIRHQAVIALQSAVSIDIFREFPKTDVEDGATRASRLKKYHYELVESSHLQPVTISDHHAQALAYSSSDAYGRSLADSVGLAAYGFRKEWELANTMGIRSDSSGYRYDVPFEHYCEQISKDMDYVVSDEFARQLHNYPNVIQLVSGRQPLCTDPIIDPIPSEVPPPRHQTIEDATWDPEPGSVGKRESNQAQNEIDLKDSVVKILQAVGRSVRNFSQKTRDTNREFREVQRDWRDRRDDRHRHQLQREQLRYYRRANKRHKNHGIFP